MKRIVKLIGCAVLLLLTITVKAQNTYDMLKSKKWTMDKSILPDKCSDVLIFTDEKFTDTFTYDGESVSTSAYYYFSNERETVFNYNKVGKTKTGLYKYIIMITIGAKTSSNKQIMSVYEIKNLSDKDYRIVSLFNKNELIYHGEPIVIEYITCTGTNWVVDNYAMLKIVDPLIDNIYNSSSGAELMLYMGGLTLKIVRSEYSYGYPYGYYTKATVGHKLDGIITLLNYNITELDIFCNTIRAWQDMNGYDTKISSRYSLNLEVEALFATYVYAKKQNLLNKFIYNGNKEIFEAYLQRPCPENYIVILNFLKKHGYGAHNDDASMRTLYTISIEGVNNGGIKIDG